MNPMLTSIPHITNNSGAAFQLRPMVYRSLIASVAAVAMLGAAYAPAFAAPGQTSTDTTRVDVVVGSAITISGLSPDFELSGIPGAGVTTAAGDVTYDVETNNSAGYTVGVLSQDAVLSPADTVANTDTIPIRDLEVDSFAGGFEPVSNTAPVIIARQTNRSALGGDNGQEANFRMTIPFVNSDTYSADLNFIATTL